MNKHQIWHVLKNVQGKFHPAGRVLVHNGQLKHLEDYHDLVKDIPEGPVDEVTAHSLAHPKAGTRIVSDDDWRAGHHLDLIPPAQLQPLWKEAASPETIEPKKPKGVWDYKHVAHDQAHTLESHGNGLFSLDGNPLKEDELKAILGNLGNKTASLRYKGDGLVDTLTKYEKLFTDLRKEEEGDLDPELSLEHLNKLYEESPDPKTKSAIASLRKHIFQDPMTGLGNKYAMSQFHAKGPQEGFHVMGDLNGMKAINDIHGHEAGDQAIKAFGGAWRDASNEAGGKGWRAGGDEVSSFFPTQEGAHQFARSLRAKLEQIPPINGTHRISTSIGMGPSLKEADKDLYQAKLGKQGTTPATIPHLLTSKPIPAPGLAPTALTSPPPATPAPSNPSPTPPAPSVPALH